MLPMVTRVLGSLVLEADECDEEPDASGHCGVELVGNGVQDHLPDAGTGEGEEKDAGKEDGAQGGLPGDCHLEADGVGEVGVQAHARRQRDGIARDDAHENGGEGRGEASGRRSRFHRYAGVLEDGRIYQHDVSHGQEGGDPGQDFGAPIGAQMLEFKIAFSLFQHGCV